MKKAALILCAAAMTHTTVAADAASPLRPMAIEAPSLLHQVGDRRGFYGGRGYHRRGFYWGGFGGYYGGYGHYDNFRPIYRTHRVYRPYRAYRSYPVYDYSYEPCNNWRQDC